MSGFDDGYADGRRRGHLDVLHWATVIAGGVLIGKVLAMVINELNGENA